MRGKYSPTVSEAYSKDRAWHEKYAGQEIYDPEGFDSYGYDANDRDRAGNEEFEYYCDDDDAGSNWKYETALGDWGFDGVKPVQR